MRFRYHSFLILGLFLFTTGMLLCSASSGKSEETAYIRVIAHNDTHLMQQQKLLIRNKALTLLSRGIKPESLEEYLDATGFPLQVQVCNWTPTFTHPARSTLQIILGKGEGHNWWGTLNPDIYCSTLFHTHQKNGAIFRDAVQNKSVVFPFLDPIFRLWKRFAVISGHPIPAANW